MSESTKTIYESHRTEQLRKELQEEINRNSYSPRVESERRQELYKKDEAEKANLKKMRAAIKANHAMNLAA